VPDCAALHPGYAETKGRIIDPAFLFPIAEWRDRAAWYRIVDETGSLRGGTAFANGSNG
jgi:hypothetical protein